MMVAMSILAKFSSSVDDDDDEWDNDGVDDNSSI